MDRLRILLSSIDLQRRYRKPISTIIGANTVVYLMWKFNIFTESFMVKNFSSHPHNLSHGRIHTLVTHSLSHTSVLNLLLDSLIFALLGSAVKKAKGHRYVWMLYLSGSLAGGLTSVIFKERSPVITPTIGSSSCVASYLSFLCLLNPRATIVLLGIPIKSWILVASMGTFSLLFDREKQSIAGITAGMVILQMMRARFI